MKNEYHNEDLFYEGGKIYETIFRWEDEWLSALIKPYNPDANKEHYVVKIINGPITFINKTTDGKWEESNLGITSRAEILGRAIQYAQMDQKLPE